MDSFEVNKIVGAILTASVVAMLAGFVANLLAGKEHTQTLVYSVAPSAVSQSAPAAAPAVKPIGPLLAAANAGSGESVAKKCAACHTLDQGGANKIGPNLWGVVNRPIASHAGYSYSSALQGKKGETWTYENLSEFLTKPKDWAPGTKMGFAGIKKPEDRADLILYLRSLSANPAALPQG